MTVQGHDGAGVSGDPGWGPALSKPHLYLFIPMLPVFLMGSWTRRGDGVTAIRVIFISMLASIAMILAITAFIAPDIEGEGEPALWAGIVAASGLFDVAMIMWARRRFLNSDMTSMNQAGASYFTTFFLSYALALSPALVGFVSVFITGDLWPMLVGYGFTIAGSLLFAPTRTRIADLERALQQRGLQGSFVSAIGPAQGHSQSS